MPYDDNGAVTSPSSFVCFLFEQETEEELKVLSAHSSSFELLISVGRRRAKEKCFLIVFFQGTLFLFIMLLILLSALLALFAAHRKSITSELI